MMVITEECLELRPKLCTSTAAAIKMISVPLLKTLNFVLLSAPLLAAIILDKYQVTSEFKYNNMVLYP
jgi:hypothetical protein